jgi:hypothetical protein
VEDNRRCGRYGAGYPPLCVRHERIARDEERGDALNQFISRGVNRVVGSIFGRHSDFVRNEISHLIDESGGDIVEKLTDTLNRMGDVNFRPEPGARPARGAPPPPRQPPPPRRNGQAARQVLGFPADLKLTPEIVKARKRKLAELFHPDKGGSPDAMRRVNQAADELLANLP